MLEIVFECVKGVNTLLPLFVPLIALFCATCVFTIIMEVCTIE